MSQKGKRTLEDAHEGTVAKRQRTVSITVAPTIEDDGDDDDDFLYSSSSSEDVAGTRRKLYVCVGL